MTEALLCGIFRLSNRKEEKCIKLGLKSLIHPVPSKIVPVNPLVLSNPENTRHGEHFLVNYAKSKLYRQSEVQKDDKDDFLNENSFKAIIYSYMVNCHQIIFHFQQ